MNILQLHDMVKFWIDEYGSPRQRPIDIDRALWASSKAIVEEKYDHTKQNHNEDSIERFQRVRDELYTIVKTTSLGSYAVTIVNNVIAASKIPEAYKYLLLLEVTALVSGTPDEDTEWQICESVSLDQKRDFLTRNPYRKPVSNAMYQRQYYEENVNGFLIHSAVSDLNYAKISYLEEPSETFIGYERAPGWTSIANQTAIAMGDVIVNTTEYSRGSLFTLVAGDTFSGDNILTSSNNTNLPITLHEEIAKKAAHYILDRSNLFQKAAAFKQEILSK